MWDFVGRGVNTLIHRIGKVAAMGGLLLYAQHKPAYLLYDAKGKPIAYKHMRHALTRADVVLFGELHDDPIAHWLCHELLRDLREGQAVALGMEMFETDQQAALDRYLRGELTMKQLGEAIQLWSNFSTDYAPIVAFAKEAGIPVYATNAPRALAREVARQGLSVIEGWSDAQKALVAPYPIPRLDSLPSYQRMAEMAAAHGMNPDYFRQAQMLKDATMAHRIVQYRREGVLFFHINGSYHSDYKEGIAAYLRLYAPHLRVVTITTVLAPDPLRYRPPKKTVADITLVVPERMTRTH